MADIKQLEKDVAALLEASNIKKRKELAQKRRERQLEEDKAHIRSHFQEKTKTIVM